MPDFPGVEAIYLEENYRSTGSILDAAHAIVSQGQLLLTGEKTNTVLNRVSRPPANTKESFYIPPQKHSRYT